MKGKFIVFGLLTLTGCDQDGDTIGPDGGVVTSRDGRVTLDIPPGALETDVVVSIEEVDDGPDGSIGRVYEILPAHTQLLVPAYIEVDLGVAKSDGDVEQQLSAATMEDVAIATARESDWVGLPDHDVDVDAQIVSGSVTYFSTYAVVLGQ